MLTSLLGIRLVLLIGPTVPLPAPAEAMTALTHAKVINDDREGDGFQLTFTLGKSPIGDYNLLSSGALNPDRRVVIGLIMGALPEPLIDGIITHHQITPSNEPGLSTLTVSGRDLSVMLDLEERNAEYRNRPDFLIATEILTQPAYAQLGLVPQTSPTADLPLELQRIPRQHETDFRFLQRLARRNGYVFYTEPLTIGVTRAYWGPENRLGLPQPALSVNLGTATNVNSLNFSQDALAPAGAAGNFVEPITKTSLRIPPLPSLRVPPLASSPAAPRRRSLMRQTAGQSPTQAATTLLAATTRSPDAISASGQLDTVRYGHILRARRLVGVRGAGLRHDGLYYVRRVTHEIEPGKYTQDFTLSREGTGALLPVVRP
ncbi:MAG TPA: hypothetical protein PKE64_19690 [Anaerolineae bacterium]|nr:hypothetical protein [Anaerolineae bacterium]